MNHPYQKFKNTLVCTSIETLLYQSTLVLYHLYLYYALGAQQYGITGALFSLIYIGAYYANMGLDITLAPMLQVYKSRRTYLKAVVCHMTFSLLLGLTVIIFLLITSFKTPYATSTQLIICCIIAISENIKKTLKIVLHLLLFHYQVTCVEICYIVIYMSIICLLVTGGSKLSFGVIMLPMLLLTWISTAVYSYLFYNYWKHDATEDDNQYNAIIRKHIILRAKGCLYQIMRGFYTTNFLVIFIATHYSMEVAGIIKLISSVYNAISSMLRYILGTTSSVMFSHEKYNLKTTGSLLRFLQTYVYTIGIGVICTIGITSVTTISITSAEYRLLFVMLTALLLSEHLSIMYESLLTVQEQITFLIICYGISISFVIYAQYTFHERLPYLYASIIGIRILHLITVHYYTHYSLQGTKNNFILSLLSKIVTCTKKECL